MIDLIRNPKKAVRKYAHIAVGLDKGDLSEQSIDLIEEGVLTSLSTLRDTNSLRKTIGELNIQNTYEMIEAIVKA
jgi:hypothetical protein